MVLDGRGERTSYLAGRAVDGGIEVLATQQLPHSLGLLYEELTASENLSFVASLFGLLWPKRGRRVKEMLKLVDLWEARGRRAVTAADWAAARSAAAWPLSFCAKTPALTSRIARS